MRIPHTVTIIFNDFVCLYLLGILSFDLLTMLSKKIVFVLVVAALMMATQVEQAEAAVAPERKTGKEIKKGWYNFATFVFELAFNCMLNVVKLVAVSR